MDQIIGPKSLMKQLYTTFIFQIKSEMGYSSIDNDKINAD